jgi:hypothetical protein
MGGGPVPDGGGMVTSRRAAATSSVAHRHWTVAGSGVMIRRFFASCRHLSAMSCANRSAAAPTCAGVLT